MHIVLMNNLTSYKTKIIRYENTNSSDYHNQQATKKQTFRVNVF